MIRYALINISQYAIKGDDKEWETALASGKSSKTLSVITGEKRLADELAKNGSAVMKAIQHSRPKRRKRKSQRKRNIDCVM